MNTIPPMDAGTPTGPGTPNGPEPPTGPELPTGPGSPGAGRAPRGNIDRHGRRLRLILGLVGVGGGVVIVGSLLLLDVGRPWRLMALLPFWVGVLGLLQAKEET